MQITSELVGAIAAQRNDLDEVLATGCKSMLDSHPGWTGYELTAALNDLWKLSQHGDACYDRPSDGWIYAGWYHARRVRDALGYLTPAILGASSSSIRVIDLGAGTGATAWSLASLIRAANEIGQTLPRLDVIAVEASQPMLETGEQLWEHMRNDQLYRRYLGDIHITWHLRSWTDITDIVRPSSSHTVVIGGYLLDASDVTRVEEIAEQLEFLLEASAADQLILTTASRKLLTLSTAARKLEEAGWLISLAPPVSLPISGALPATHHVRTEGFRTRAATDDAIRKVAQRPPSWDDTPIGVTFDRSKPVEHLVDVNPGRLRLDPSQEAAAEPSGRLTAILGAAGSGKSQVLIERVARVVESWRALQGSPPVVLVTSYNKKMIRQLSEWLGARLEGSHVALRLAPGNDWYRYRHPGEPAQRPRIDLVHVDKLAYAACRSYVNSDADWLAKTERRISDSPRGQLTEAQQRALSPRFLLDELRRVVAAQNINSLDEYVAADRWGRRSTLSQDAKRLVWDAIVNSTKGFPHLRMEWLRSARAQALNGVPPAFTHVFVDECQDFTLADFEAMSYLLPDPNNMVVTGDETQALHLGPTYRRPGQVEIPPPYRVPGGVTARRWDERRLAGSHRLPVRVSECVRGLAAAVERDRRFRGDGGNDIVLPIAMKPAVLGTRPIVVASSTIDTTLPAILVAYQRYATPSPARRPFLTVVEDARLTLPIPGGWDREDGSMLDLKGLERWAVLWRTSSPLPDSEAEAEWVYTIVTRSCGILILAIDPTGTSSPVKRALTELDRERLLFWDELAEASWAVALL